MVSITIDCEEWNSPHLRGRKDRHHNSTQFSKIGNRSLLCLFDKYNVKATFFVTGYYAENEPESVREIYKAGHEIACHGYTHHYRGRSFDVAEDVRRGKKVLEKITGSKVLGFRAPQVQYSLRLLEVLAEEGFKYDSSLHPAILPGYYNNSKFPIRIHKPLAFHKITEIPVAVMPRSRLPIVWMFMRLLGVHYTQLGINALERKGINANLYFHSWEFAAMKSNTVPFYFTKNTGRPFLEMLDKLIRMNLHKGRKFSLLKDTC